MPDNEMLQQANDAYDQLNFRKARKLFLRVPQEEWDVETFRRMTYCELTRKKYKPAEKFARKAIEIDPGLIKAHLNRSYGLLGLRRYQKAEKAVLTAIELLEDTDEKDSLPSQAYLNLSGVLTMLKRYDEAEQAIETAIALLEDTEDNLFETIWNQYAQIKFYQEDYDAAGMYAQKSLEINPEGQYPHLVMMDILNKQKKTKDALKEMKIAYQIQPSPRLLYLLIRQYSATYSWVLVAILWLVFGLISVVTSIQVAAIILTTYFIGAIVLHIIILRDRNRAYILLGIVGYILLMTFLCLGLRIVEVIYSQ